MLILGASGHAKEILDVLEKNGYTKSIYFYDDLSNNSTILFGKYTIIKSLQELNNHNLNSKNFVLGIGNPHRRKIFADKFLEIGWNLTSVISDKIQRGNHNVHLGKGINLMHNVFISNDVIIGDGTLINAGSYIHHDVHIGNYCEISPNTTITGKVEINNLTFIGAGTVILPGVKIGNNCIIGAGSVVTKNLPDNVVAYGNPARLIKPVETPQ